MYLPPLGRSAGNDCKSERRRAEFLVAFRIAPRSENGLSNAKEWHFPLGEAVSENPKRKYAPSVFSSLRESLKTWKIFPWKIQIFFPPPTLHPPPETSREWSSSSCFLCSVIGIIKQVRSQTNHSRRFSDKISIFFNSARTHVPVRCLYAYGIRAMYLIYFNTSGKESERISRNLKWAIYRAVIVNEKSGETWIIQAFRLEIFDISKSSPFGFDHAPGFLFFLEWLKIK